MKRKSGQKLVRGTKKIFLDDWMVCIKNSISEFYSNGDLSRPFK